MMLLVTVFGLGLSLTTSSAAAYLHQLQTWRYLIKNAILFRGIEFALPGIKGVLNGSLWSLAPEVRMYAALLALWLLAALAGRFRLRVPGMAIVAIAAASGALYLYRGQFEPLDNLPRLTYMFFAGASFYVLRDVVALHRVAFVLLLGAIAASFHDRVAFFYALSISLPYLVLYAAYAISGPIRAFNSLGDYSYGIYIYAFPVQAALCFLVHPISIPVLMTSSAVITTTLAALSWHLLEKKALVLKTAFASKLDRQIDSLFRPLLAFTRN